MLFKRFSILSLLLFLAACQGSGSSLNSSSVFSDPSKLGIIYFGLVGDSITCRKPHLVFGIREGGGFHRVDFGRQGWEVKDNIVQFRAPAGTYALLSISCQKGTTVTTLGLGNVGKSKSLYRGGLALFTLKAGEKINGGAVTAAALSNNILSSRYGLVLVTPMPAALKAKLAQTFPDAAQGVSERLMQRETRSEAEQAYQKCISEKMASMGDDTKENVENLRQCLAIDPHKAVE